VEEGLRLLIRLRKQTKALAEIKGSKTARGRIRQRPTAS